MTDRPASTTTVTLHGQCYLYPDGTTYGGGAASHRDPDAAPVEDTPCVSLAAALSELGSMGEALRWALDRDLVRACAPVRDVVAGDRPEPVDVVSWEGTMSLPDWSTFAEAYLLDVDPLDRRPTRAALVGTRRWVDHADGMLFNVGGVTRVHHARMEITVEEPHDPTTVALPDREALLGRLRADDTVPDQIDGVFRFLAANLADTGPRPEMVAAWIDTALDTYVERARPTVHALATTRMLAESVWVDRLVEDPTFADRVRAVWRNPAGQ